MLAKLGRIKEAQGVVRCRNVLDLELERFELQSEHRCSRQSLCLRCMLLRLAAGQEFPARGFFSEEQRAFLQLVGAGTTWFWRGCYGFLCGSE